MRIVTYIALWVFWFCLLAAFGVSLTLLAVGSGYTNSMREISSMEYITVGSLACIAGCIVYWVRKRLYWTKEKFSLSSPSGAVIFAILSLSFTFLGIYSTMALTIVGAVNKLNIGIVGGYLLAAIFLILGFPKLPKRY
jgi:hypothetical protein